MAEFSRRAGKRILENIDTSKASKQDVYDFYRRSRAQLMRRGEAVDPLLKLNDVRKSDLVAQISKLTQQERESSIAKDYKKFTASMTSISPSEAAQKYQKFEQRLQRLSAAGEIDLSKVMGGQLEEKFEVESTNYKGQSQTKYYGRLAHDLVAQWVEDDLLDTAHFEDSEDIWMYMDDVRQNDEKFDNFGELYRGKQEKGSYEYYEEFKQYLGDISDFESEYKKRKRKLPPYGSTSYNLLFLKWQKSQPKKRKRRL